MKPDSGASRPFGGTGKSRGGNTVAAANQASPFGRTLGQLWCTETDGVRNDGRKERQSYISNGGIHPGINYSVLNKMKQN